MNMTMTCEKYKLPVTEHAGNLTTRTENSKQNF